MAARRLRSRRAPRRPRPALRDAAERRTPRVQLHRPRDDRRHVPDRAGARRGDVRAGSLRPHGDERDRSAGSRARTQCSRDVTGRGLRSRGAAHDKRRHICRLSERSSGCSSSSVSLRRRSGRRSSRSSPRCGFDSVRSRRSCSTSAMRPRRSSSIARACRCTRRCPATGRAASGCEADRLPPMLVAATIAAEDRRFYSHPGVDPIAIVRARRGANIAERQVVEGGSTITQQAAKLLLARKAPARSRAAARASCRRRCSRCGSSIGSPSARSSRST